MDIDLKLWMTNLDLCTRRIPIIFLAIPGTHDSMTFSINQSSGPSPDCIKLIRFFLKFGFFAKRIVVGWSVTQTLTVKEQLYHGIRYFDLRIAKKDEDDKFYYVHSLFGSEIEGKLKEICKFLEENEKEIVILDFQHFYNLQKEDHISLIELIDRIFGSKICPDPCDIQSITLDWMEKNFHQVVVIYRDNMHCIDNRFWPSYKFPTPWPNTTDIGYLTSFLRSGLKDRKPNHGYVSQCVLTPDDRFVILHVCGNLKCCCAVPCLQAILPWIDSQHAGDCTGMNVIISDFVEQNNAVFCRSVVKLNYKIFSSKSLE